jgi:hypothetical protein
VSHLGDLLSALVDGELSGTEFDRARSHLAACADCQAEASSLRQLKRDLRALAASCDADGITGRLLAMTGDDALAARLSALSPHDESPTGSPGGCGGAGHPDLGGHAGPARRLPRRRQPGAPAPTRPRGGLRAGTRGRRRGRYVLWGTVSVVVVGIGTAAFGMGGGGGSTGPRITPQVEVFDVEHAVTTGDIPYADPADVPPRLPEVARHP